jgi:transposase
MTDQPKYRDEAWLREQYVDHKLESPEIANKCDCTPSTIIRWLDRHDIETGPPGGRSENRRLRCLPDERLANQEWMRKQYVGEVQSAREIAEKCGCDESTAQRWLKRHGIEMNPDLRKREYPRLANAEWLRQEYVKKNKTGYQIADEVGCSFGRVYASIREHGIETRDIGNWPSLSGSEHPNWNGGLEGYGPGWTDTKRRDVRQRDDHTCQDPRCSVTQDEHLDQYGEKLHVHHLRKALDVDDAEQRNAEENLITLCRDCHRHWEQIADTGLVPQGVEHGDD